MENKTKVEILQMSTPKESQQKRNTFRKLKIKHKRDLSPGSPYTRTQDNTLVQAVHFE